jgi:hypothetical protein
MIEKSLRDTFKHQIAATNQAIEAEQAKLRGEEDGETSLRLREKCRLLAVFAGEVEAALTKIVLADVALVEGEKKFLRWRVAYHECINLQDEHALLAAKLEKARADVEHAQQLVDAADEDIRKFPRLDPAKFPTEPAKEKERVALAKLEGVRSEAMAKRDGLQAASGDALRAWLECGQRLAAGEFRERMLRPVVPVEESHSMGQLLPVA